MAWAAGGWLGWSDFETSGGGREVAWRAAAAEEAASECSWSENRQAPLTQSSAGRPTPPSLQTQDKLLKLIEKSCKDASGVTAVTATTLPYSNKISEFSR